MSYRSRFTVTPTLLSRVESIAAPRERIQGAVVQVRRISKQGAMDLLRPLVKSGLVKRVGTVKTGRYVLN